MFPTILSRRLSVLNPGKYYRACGLFTSNVNRFKEIKIEEKDDEIRIEAVPIESDRKEHLVPFDKITVHDGKTCKSCPLCRLNLKNLVFSDVLILSQFIDSSGNLLYRSVTGLCPRSHGKVKKLVGQAQKARLLPRPPEYVSYGPWDNLNTYFEYPRRKRDQPMHVVREEYWE